MMEKKKAAPLHAECSKHFMAIRDTMELLSGKWKIQMLGVLIRANQPLRFMDLLREVDGIAAKMLSKELHELEINELVKRTVMDTKPITVEYEITTYGKSLEPLINEIARWGAGHRKRLLKRTN